MIVSNTIPDLFVSLIDFIKFFEFGRNSTESQMKASNASGSSKERPTIWDNLKTDRSNQSALQATTSFVSDVGVGLFTNLAMDLEKFIYQINPLRGFANSLDGINTDMRNIRTELGIETQVLNVGDDRKFINIDGKGNKIGEFTFADYLKDPTLAANKLFSNGIMNNFDNAQTNALSQLKTPDESGRITILFDPSAAPDVSFGEDPWGNIFGLGSDLFEVSVNYLGANVLGGLIQTKGQKTDQDFIAAVANKAKQNGDVITLAGHSGGGLRNYLTLANSTQGQYLDANGNSVLQVQFSGTPVNNYDLMYMSNNSGAKFLRSQNNSGDTVGLVLGGNGSGVDALSGVGHLGQIFGIYGTSPHSNYGCNGYWCNAKGDINFDFKNYEKYISKIKIMSDL